MPYAGPSPYAGAAPFAGAAPSPTSPPAVGSPFGGSFAGARPFAGPAPFAGAPATPASTPTTIVVATDSASFADGTQPTAGAAFGLFDAFTDTYGTALQSHAPTGGSGSWAKHGAMPSSDLVVGGYGGNRLARGSYSGLSVYVTDSGHSGADVRATWSQGDDEVILAADGRCGVGLRVDPTVDTGYYAIGSNNDGTSTYQWAIVKRVAGSETVLATAAKSPLILTPASLDFSAVGSTLTLKVNGSTVATATDSAIAGPGRFAAMFSLSPQSEGNSWIDDLSIGGVGATTKLAPERVFATVVGIEPVRWAEVTTLTVVASATATVQSTDGSSFADLARVLATLRPTDAAASADAYTALATVRTADSAATYETLKASATVASSDAFTWLESASLSATISVADWSSAVDVGVVEIGPAGIVVVTATDGFAASEGSASVAATIAALESVGWVERATVSAGIFACDSASASEAWATRVLVATLTYSIYGNDGAGGAIDYSTPIGTTTTTSFDVGPLDAPGLHRFGVRVTSMLTWLEEANADAVVTIALDATGVDVTSRPAPVVNLRAYAAAGGVVRVEWSHAMPTGETRPTGFRVYVGTPTPDYGSPYATVPATSSFAGSFRADVSGLTDGTTYAVAVRAYNATSEDASTSYITAVPDATPPASVDGLTGVAREA